MTRTSPQLFSFFLVAASVAALGTAYTAQYRYGLEPCVLCLYQRVPYAIAGALGLLGFATGGRHVRLIALCAVVLFLVEAGIAFYHVGVEQHWWASVTSCGGKVSDIKSTDALLQALQAKPEKACDDVDWTLFGISMATYNVAMSLVLAAMAEWFRRRFKAEVR